MIERSVEPPSSCTLVRQTLELVTADSNIPVSLSLSEQSLEIFLGQDSFHSGGAGSGNVFLFLLLFFY